MQDRWSEGTAAEPARQSDQLPLVLTALANFRVRPEVLAQLLLAVPDEVLRRCGVLLARMAGDERSLSGRGHR